MIDMRALIYAILICSLFIILVVGVAIATYIILDSKKQEDNNE